MTEPIIKKYTLKAEDIRNFAFPGVTRIPVEIRENVKSLLSRSIKRQS